MEKKITVTSALPYANGSIHLGHLFEYIQTDIFVRFLRLTGKDAIYVCADDAHGVSIQIAAQKAGVTPEEFIKKSFKEHQEDIGKYHISFDAFHTTHSEENKKHSQDFFNKLKAKGDIYQKEIEQLYDEQEQRFLPDRYVKGTCPKCGAEDQYGDVCEQCGTTYDSSELVNPVSVLSGTTPVLRKTTHYFFKLSAYSERLKKWLEGNKALQPEVVNSVRQWIDEGLNDWDITRDAPYFGFLIPGEEDKYFYVWLDAPIGYLSSTEHYCTTQGKNFDDYWTNADRIHVIGKDITYFHFLFWPAMLMGVGYELPNYLIVHGFINVNGKKMSKSRGTFITAKKFSEMFEPEYLRFYFGSLLGRKMADVNLDFKDFQDRINNELVANFGNFCNRILSYSKKNFGAKVKAGSDPEFMQEVDTKIEKIKEDYGNFQFISAIKEIMAISAMGNKYFQDKEPWKLIKEDKDKVEEVCGVMITLMKKLAILISPVLPISADKLREQLCLDTLSWDDLNKEYKEHTIGEVSILFKKIETLPKLERKALCLKVGAVEEVEDHPNSDRLYKLTVNLGNEKRTIIAGLKEYITAEDFKGRNVVVVTNLKPAKLRGIVSQGMILAGEEDGTVEPLNPKGNPGDLVYGDEQIAQASEIVFDDFKSFKLLVKNGFATCNGEILRTDKEKVKIEMKDGSIIR